MALIADTGGLYAIYDRDDKYHEAVLQVIEQERGDLIIPDTILAEIDYLLRNRLGVSAELDFLEEILAGTYTLYRLDSQDLLRCQELLSRYRNLNLGLADTAVMATAERLNIYRVLTLDERDFRAVRLNKPLVILPADVQF
jgi:predicted nucleic acid-binding protein